MSRAAKLLEDWSSDSSSDEFDDMVEQVVVRASVASAKLVHHLHNPKRPYMSRHHIERQRLDAHARLEGDYFGDTPRWPTDEVFKDRFRMTRRLFLRIRDDLERERTYFQQRRDARGKLGFTALQKCTAAIRMLAFGKAADINDDYLHMAAKTIRDTVKEFTSAIVDIYGERYLRKPTWYDLQKIYEVHAEEHGLPGMIGSIDCMHWSWEKCPTAWRGQHTRGDQKGPTRILQAVCSQDLWVWHAYFGAAGSNNDINVLEQSPIIEDFIAGNVATASFYANDSYYPYGYFLGDGIYPEYSIIVKTFRDPIDPKRAYFKKVQESSRKDIERCFGVLKQRWGVLRSSCKLWYRKEMETLMMACIILHNMILEDEGNAYCQDYNPQAVQDDQNIPRASMEQRIQNSAFMKSRENHACLMADLVEHVWKRKQLRASARDDGVEVEDEDVHVEVQEAVDEDDNGGAQGDDEESEDGDEEGDDYDDAYYSDD